MGYGTKERLDKQAKYLKKNGKSKTKVTMKQAKGKNPANVSKIVERKEDKKS